MGRRKITMEFISKGSVRASTFKKRKASLFKKAKELATLCGVDVSLVVSAGPDDSAPEVWPSLEAVSNMASRANDCTTNDKHTKTKARQVTDIQVELKNLEMENLAMEAELFLEETLSRRSQVSEVASPELAMRLWAMLETRKMAVDDRINSLLSLQVPFHSAAPHVRGFSDVPNEARGLFSDLPANMAYTSQLCGAEWMQIDGRPPLKCWPAAVDVSAEMDANLPIQVPFSPAAPDMGQPGLSDLPTETGEFFSGLPSETSYSSDLRGVDLMSIDDGPPIVCWQAEVDVGAEIDANFSVQVGFSSAGPDIEQPGLSDLPIEMEQLFSGLPAETAYSSEVHGSDWMRIDDRPPIVCWPMEDVIGEDQINAIPSEQAHFSSAVPDIELPSLLDLPNETKEFFTGLPSEIAF